MHLDAEACYLAVKSRDRRFDGRFVTAVHTTGIYCRPSCPARTPARVNVSFFPTAAAAHGAGFRACKRCLPDATPGDPGWDLTGDTAGRAMRLIADGVVDRDGVPGLAAQLGYTPRHLGRILTSALGAAPLALARARRAQTARVLVETTDLPLGEIAFASGFSSLRQFNETFAAVYATPPSDLRRRRAVAVDGRGARPAVGSGGTPLTVHHRLAVRTPFAGRALLSFLARRAVPGVEAAGSDWFARTLDLPHGPGTVQIELDDHLEPGNVAQVRASFELCDLRDLGAAVERTRRVLDADCDPVAVDGHLGDDPLLAPLVRRHPGLRVPGHVAGDELAVRAVLGQQITVAAARTLAGRLVAEFGQPVPGGSVPGLTHLFPRPEALVAHDLSTLAMPRSRSETLSGLATLLAEGSVRLDHGQERDDVAARLLAVRGIGPWTVSYTLMRALAHPDLLLETDVGTRSSWRARAGGAELATRSHGWRPWRSYAQMHLWQALTDDDPGPRDRAISEETPCGP